MRANQDTIKLHVNQIFLVFLLLGACPVVYDPQENLFVHYYVRAENSTLITGGCLGDLRVESAWFQTLTLISIVITVVMYLLMFGIIQKARGMRKTNKKLRKAGVERRLLYICAIDASLMFVMTFTYWWGAITEVASAVAVLNLGVQAFATSIFVEDVRGKVWFCAAESQCNGLEERIVEYKSVSSESEGIQRSISHIALPYSQTTKATLV